eukprot:8788544-Pyramimonas_sp.AAC.1
MHYNAGNYDSRAPTAAPTPVSNGTTLHPWHARKRRFPSRKPQRPCEHNSTRQVPNHRPEN